MKTTVTLLVLFTLFSPNTFAQSYVQWGLAEGAKARLGKGRSHEIQYSPDGRHLAVTSSIGIWLCGTATHQEVGTLTVHTGPVSNVVFSLDEGTLVSGNADNTVYLWEVMTDEHKRTLAGHTSGINSVAFSPDGKTLASGSSDETVRLWDAVTGKYKRTLTGHMSVVTSVAFSSDGRTLASSGGIRCTTIRLWDAVTGMHKRTLTGHTSGVNSVVFSPDGRTLASSGGIGDETIRLWDAATGVHTKVLTGHTGAVDNLAFSPAGKTLASGSEDKTICLWDAVTGMHKRTLTGHTSWVNDVVFSPDGRMLASGSGDKTIRLWDTVTGMHKRTLIGHTSGVNSVVFSPDGRTLASGSGDKTIRLWNAVTGMHKHILTGHTSGVNSIAFSPDGRVLASGSADGTVLLWNISAPRPIFDSNPPSVVTPPVKPDSSTPPRTSANQVYNNAIRAVMWIVNPSIGEGSGVLFDRKFKLAVTNAHVTGTSQAVDVYFPAPDENGKLIKERDFYLKSRSVLKRLGYYTKGHVVAKNVEMDLTIIRLDGLPETARQIDWAFTTPPINTGELVYILGNPRGRDLWHWKLGQFQNDYGKVLHIQSDIFGGNSGGPVLNRQGILLGIIARSDRHMNASAIPARYINQLLSESNVKHSGSRR